MKNAPRKFQLTLAAAALVVAAALAFTALLIRPAHDIEAGVCMVCAQFLVLCASILGIDYKFGTYDTTGNSKQQPA